MCQIKKHDIFFLISIFIPAAISCCPSCCSGCKQNSPVNKAKCADESPLCSRLEPLCENIFFAQWNEMRCACPKTCKLCTETETPEAEDYNTTISLPKSTQMPMQAPTRCDSDPIDVGLVLDGSGSIGHLFEQQVLRFAAEFARALGVSATGHRLGVVQYSDRARTEIRMGQYNTPDELEAAISQIRMIGGGTMTGAGINWAHYQLFDFTRNASKACIVLTDGMSGDNVQYPATNLRHRGVHIIAIGVGTHFNRAELEQIADNPQHVYMVDSFQNLNSTLVARLNTLICQDAGAEN